MLKICGTVLTIDRRDSMDPTARSESIEEMRSSRGNASTVFMKFTEYKPCFGDHVFSFYEGEDGKYYNSRIKEVAGEKLIHIKANGKSVVLKVMNIIQSKNEYDKVTTMFFVDRDMDYESEELVNNDLYVTPCYSIENLYVGSEVLGLVLEDEFGLNCHDTDYKKCIELFNKCYEQFCALMTDFNALILLRKEKGLNCGQICVQGIKTSKLVSIDIQKGLSYSKYYQNEIDKLKEAIGVSDQEILEARKRLIAKGNPGFVFRGKNQLFFFTTFITQLKEKKESIFNPVPTSVNIFPKQNSLSTLSKYAKTPEELIVFIKKHCIKNKQAALC